MISSFTRCAGLAFGLACGLGVVGCGGVDASPPPPPAATASNAPSGASSVDAAWVAVRPAGAHPLLEAPARVVADPDRRAFVSVASRARVIRLLVRPGDRVTAGMPLVELAYPDLAATAASYLAALDQLSAYDKRRIQLEALRADGLARVGDLSAVEVELARLRGDREVAAASLRSAGLDPASARGLVDSGGKSRMRAPIDGTVVATDAVAGQLRTPDGGHLVEIARSGGQRVEAQLAVPFPAQAALEFVPLSGPAHAAHLIGEDPHRGPDGSRRIWLEVDGELPTADPGRIRARVGDDVVAVPASSIARDGAGEFVWRRDGDRRVRAAVTILSRAGAEALVRGLQVGDHVVARNAGGTP